jgi:putative transposon-encoded protein
MKRKISEKPMEIRMQGYEVVEKVVTQHATSAKVLVPRHWIGKRVRAVRLDPFSEEDKKEE